MVSSHRNRTVAAALYVLGLVLLVLLVLLVVSPAAAADLKPGDRAPSFSLPGSDGKQWRLEELLGEKGGVVLAWFPKAFTPG